MNAPTWFLELLKDPEVTDICINGKKQVFVDRGEGLVYSPHTFDPMPWALEQIALCKRSWSAHYPFINARLQTGHRLHVAFPPVSGPEPLLSIRMIRPQKRTWFPHSSFEYLKNVFQNGKSILLCGGTGSGKTSLSTDLIDCVSPQERILCLEDVPEIKPSHPHFISLQTREQNSDSLGSISLKMLLKEALRMRPDRIVLGECRGEEVLDYLQILNTGHSGALATIHANSTRDATHRVELLAQLSSGSFSASTLRGLLCRGIQVIAFLKRTEEGKREIREISEVVGLEGDTILLKQC